MSFVIFYRVKTESLQNVGNDQLVRLRVVVEDRPKQKLCFIAHHRVLVRAEHIQVLDDVLAGGTERVHCVHLT